MAIAERETRQPIGDTTAARAARAGHMLASFAGGWAGDITWQGSAPWVAWAACDDPEPALLERVSRDWRLREGATVDEWRARSRGAAFSVTLARLDEAGGGAPEPRVLSQSDRSIEGPVLAAVPGRDAPSVAWSERRGPGSALLASVAGGAVETVAESRGAILGPRLAVAGGRLWAVWQQWAGAAVGSGQWAVGSQPHEGPAIVAASRDLSAAAGAAGAWSRPQMISAPGMSSWAPAVAAAPDGTLWCAWDVWVSAGAGSGAGGVYHIYIARMTPDGTWSEPVRVSPAGGNTYHLAPDVAVYGGAAWVVWNTSRRWGQVNHRFNHARGLQAAVVTVAGERSDLTVQPAPGRPVLGEAGRLPVFSIPFLHSTEEEFITPLAPRVRAGSNGPVVFYRQFRTAEFKDFGWDVYAVAHTGEDWAAPQRVSSVNGFPDTPYGAVASPPSNGTGSGWLVAYHAGEYPRDRLAHPSKPVAGHRFVVERAGVEERGPAATPAGLYYQIVEVEHVGPPHPSSPAARAAAGTGATATGPTPAIRANGQTYALLWGDLHRHSAYSKCMAANDGDPLDHWRWVHDVAPLDFYALTEHLEYMSYVEWRRIDDLAQRLAGSGVLALCGFEFSNEPGHTNFFYADDAVGHDLRVACLSAAEGVLSEVWPKLDAWVPPEKVVAIRHHQGHRGDVTATYAPRYEPVAEIIQTRGEYPDWLQALWRQGFKVGVVGASDHSRGAPFVQALTGLWLPPVERTREGVLAGLRARRTFATNGVRLSVFLSAGPADADGSAGSVAPGQPAAVALPVAMGESGRVAGPPRVRIEVHGTRPIETVEFYRDAALLHVAHLAPKGSPDVVVEHVDTSAPAGTEHVYWARVTQGPERNGIRPHRGVAYPSPVWLTVHQEAGTA